MNGIRNFLATICGVYTPVVASDGSIPSGLAGVDWPYVLTALLVIITIYSIFRIIGGMLCRTR